MPQKKSLLRRIYIKNKSRFERSFTLIELMISVSIFAVISIAIFSTFFSGASLLRRIKNFDLVQQKLFLKAERFARELRQEESYRYWLFQGSKNKISFPGNLDHYPSRVTYFFDDSRKSLMRSEDTLNKIITNQGAVDPELKSPAKVFISQVKEARFYYLLRDTITKIYSWQDEWAEGFLPAAVKFTIVTENQNYETTIFLPTA